jgi:hypothetical protein
VSHFIYLVSPNGSITHNGALTKALNSDYDDLDERPQKESKYAGIRALQTMNSSIERSEQIRQLSLLMRTCDTYEGSSRELVNLIFEAHSKLPSLRVLNIIGAIICKTLNQYYTTFTRERGLNEYPPFKQLTVLFWDSFWENHDCGLSALWPLLRRCQGTLEEFVLHTAMINNAFSTLWKITLPKLRKLGIVHREGFPWGRQDPCKPTMKTQAAAFFVNHSSLEILEIRFQGNGGLWTPDALDPACLPNLKSYSGAYSFFSRMIEAGVPCLKSTLEHLELPSSALRPDSIRNTLQAAQHRSSISGEGKPLLSALVTIEFLGDFDLIPLDEGTEGLQLWSTCCGPALQSLGWHGIRILGGLAVDGFSLSRMQLVDMVGGFKGIKTLSLHNFFPVDRLGLIQVQSEVVSTTLQSLARFMPMLEEVNLYYAERSNGYTTVWFIRHPIPEGEKQQVSGRNEDDRIGIRIVRHWVDSFRISPSSGIKMCSNS